MRIPANLRTTFLKKAIKNGLKMLIYDIETSHALCRTFYIGRMVSIYHNQIVRPSQVMSIQYMWGTEKKAKYLEWDKHFDGFDDSIMIDYFSSEILPLADIIVTQNGDKFDFLTLNERAKALHVTALAQKPSIDILKLSRKSFKTHSHKLDYRSSQQGLGGKIKMTDDDWVDIEERGVPISKKMGPYGCKDVEDTHKLMWKELEYYKDLPLNVEKVIMSFLDEKSLKTLGKNIPVASSKELCTNCNLDVMSKGYGYSSEFGKYRRWKCYHCGANGRYGRIR